MNGKYDWEKKEEEFQNCNVLPHNLKLNTCWCICYVCSLNREVWGTKFTLGSRWTQYTTRYRVKIKKVEIVLVYNKDVQIEFQMSDDDKRNCNKRMVNERSNFQLLTEDFLLQNNLLHTAVWWLLQTHICNRASGIWAVCNIRATVHFL